MNALAEILPAATGRPIKMAPGDLLARSDLLCIEDRLRNAASNLSRAHAADRCKVEIADEPALSSVDGSGELSKTTIFISCASGISARSA